MNEVINWSHTLLLKKHETRYRYEGHIKKFMFKEEKGKENRYDTIIRNFVGYNFQQSTDLKLLL